MNSDKEYRSKVFRENLDRLIDLHDMTKSSLAEKIEISSPAVYHWYSDPAFPTIPVMIRICDVLDCTPNDLFLTDEEKRSGDSETVSKEAYYSLLKATQQAVEVIQSQQKQIDLDNKGLKIF